MEAALPVFSVQNVIIWIVVGVAVGWLAEAVLKETRFGAGGDMLVATLGAFFGTWLLRALGEPLSVNHDFYDAVIMAVVGASGIVILLSVMRQLSRPRDDRW